MASMEKFKDRLKKACQACPNIPEYGKGEQVVIAKHLRISQEAVRKWFSGESEPRGERLEELASLLNADPSWLSLGVTPILNKSQKDSIQQLTKGVLYTLAGMIYFEGGHLALPKESDPAKSYIDIYCIMDGMYTAFHATRGVEIESGIVEFSIPLEYERVHVVGAYLNKENGQVTWFDFSSKLIQANRKSQDGDFKVTALFSEGKLTIAKGTLKTFTKIKEII